MASEWPVEPYLPHRTEEGHGLSEEAVAYLSGKGASLIITVDCGVTSVAEVSRAKELGTDVIITDHHTPPTVTPQALAIINPRMPDSSYPFDGLCGAGLAFKLIQGIYEFYGQPWNHGLLELAALGTIADLVPLVDENRFLVSEGLAELSHTTRPGLRALYRRAGIQPQNLNSETVSLPVIAPLERSGSHDSCPEQLSAADNGIGSRGRIFGGGNRGAEPGTPLPDGAGRCAGPGASGGGRWAGTHTHSG